MWMMGELARPLGKGAPKLCGGLLPEPALRLQAFPGGPDAGGLLLSTECTYLFLFQSCQLALSSPPPLAQSQIR